MGLTREQKRFWAKVEKTETCWLWTGAKSANGYGTVRFDGKLQKAHRVAWQLRHGPIPTTAQVWERLELFHMCGVRSCVRPDHMDLAPRGFSTVGRPQNVRRTRGRPRKLTAEQVVAIRELAPTHRYTQIAKTFGVSSSTVSSIAPKRPGERDGMPAFHRLSCMRCVFTRKPNGSFPRSVWVCGKRDSAGTRVAMIASQLCLAESVSRTQLIAKASSELLS
jgi:hypothetical protein